MRPIIGLTPSIQTDGSRLTMPMSYANVVREAGGTPVLLPITQEADVIAAYADLVDGLLFTGGDDVDPLSYGEDQLWACGEVIPMRDAFEISLVRTLLSRHPEKPVLGICRGEQILNVALGGTLYQDLRSQVAGSIAHQQHQTAGYVSHRVHFDEGSKLAEIYGCTEVMVNSHHHQAVKEIAPGLRITARAMDGVVEGYEMADHPYYVGVQWHPERLVEREENALHKRLFKSFVDACMK